MNETIVEPSHLRPDTGRAEWPIRRVASVVIAVIVTSAALGALAQRTFMDTKSGSGVVKFGPVSPKVGLVNGHTQLDEPRVRCRSTHPTKVVTVEYRFPTTMHCATLVAVKPEQPQPTNTLGNL